MKLRCLALVLVALAGVLPACTFGQVSLYPAPKDDPTSLPVITADSAIVIAADTGQVLWQKDPDTPRFPASTTKIMTALLLLENTSPGDRIVAPADIEKVTGANLYLKPGESLTSADALYAIMLRSANDVCSAIARHIGGSDASFAELMNRRAKELGCSGTTFRNPHGLNDDAHRTTARDLAIIAREAMKHPEFRIVVRTKRKTITRSLNPYDRYLKNHNRYLFMDATADGIKTGWTLPAGQCYVGSATRKGVRFITVLLHSTNWVEDHKALIEWAFANFDLVSAVAPSETRWSVAVGQGEANQVGLAATGPITYYLMKSAGSTEQWDLRTEIPFNVSAPITKGQVIGKLVATGPLGQRITTDLVAASDVPKRRHLLSNVDLSLPGLIMLSCMAGGLYALKRKARR